MLGFELRGVITWQVIKTVLEKFGGIDILVNNAAEQHVHDKLEDVTPEEWDRTFKTNIYSMFYLSK